MLKTSRWKREQDEEAQFQCPNCASKKHTTRKKHIVCLGCGCEYMLMRDGDLVCVARPLTVDHGSMRQVAREMGR